MRIIGGGFICGPFDLDEVWGLKIEKERKMNDENEFNFQVGHIVMAKAGALSSGTILKGDIVKIISHKKDDNYALVENHAGIRLAMPISDLTYSRPLETSPNQELKFGDKVTVELEGIVMEVFEEHTVNENGVRISFDELSIPKKNMLGDCFGWFNKRNVKKINNQQDEGGRE